eukprot:m.506892 g.506892  ORF g.506892 m.506892 type:complete len:87 (+) comp57375_c0_seq9:320-580(+)
MRSKSVVDCMPEGSSKSLFSSHLNSTPAINLKDVVHLVQLLAVIPLVVVVEIVCSLVNDKNVGFSIFGCRWQRSATIDCRRGGEQR